MPDSTLNPSLKVKPVDGYKVPTPPEQIPATPEAVDDAIKEAPQISAAVVAESKPYKGHVFPLETSSNELYAFQQYLTNEPKYLADPAPLKMGWIEKKLFDPKVIINKMNFEAYWKLRAFQIQQLQKQLKLESETNTGLYSNRLNLKRKKNSEEFETDSYIKQILNGIGKKEDRIAYLNQILKLFEDVTITVDSNNTASIKKNDETLVTIKEDTSNGLNNMEFEIPLAIINGDDKAKLEHAIALMLDQATRVLERSHDTKKEFVISGYEDSPEVVLRMYYSALLQGLKPKIDGPTLEYWEKHDKEQRFKDALDKYELLKNTANKPKKIKKLRKNHGHLFSLQQAKKEDPKDPETTTPSEPPTKHQKFK